MAVSTTTTDPWAASTSLGDRVILFDPSSARTPSAADVPIKRKHLDLIVLCSWVNARRPNIAKYILGHRLLHPQAMILVIESSITDMALRSDAAVGKRLRRALDEIIVPALDSEAHPLRKPRVLLHVFSNGGATIASRLLTFVPPRLRAARVWAGVVLDSCPGGVSWRRSVNAVVLSLPRTGWWRWIARPVAFLLVSVLLLVETAFRRENIIAVARRRLNDASLLATDIPRLYVYSEADELVWWPDVADHASAAKKAGYETVDMLSVPGSKHCAHIIGHAGEYWSAVQNLVAIGTQ